MLCSMETKGATAFKYKSGGGENTGLLAFTLVSLIAVFGAIAVWGPWCAVAFMLPLGGIIHLIRTGAQKGLIIGTRYLIAGDAIIYYGTVARAQLDRKRLVLTLVSERGKRLMIEAGKFPSNARKDFKIKANQQAKFDKAVEKILARLSGVTPEIIG